MALGNLASRFLIAVLLVPILLVAIYYDRHEAVWSIVFVASAIGMYEFFAMHFADKADRYVGVALGLLACGILYWLPSDRGGHLLPVFVAMVGPALYFVFRFGDIQTAAPRIGAMVTGILYAGLLFQFVALLKKDGGTGDLVLLVLATPWGSDTSAYFAGRFLGKRKLYPALSPGKTWAGAIGGLTGAVATASILKLTRLEQLEWVDVAVIGLVGGALCQLGDLFESMLKRSCGVKDSGTILGGHGGMLDRVDAVLWFAPFVFLYLQLRG